MIGKRIRERRRRMLMKQRELGGERWTRSYVSQIELGKVDPSLENLIEMARRLDTTAGDLLAHDVFLGMAKTMLLQDPALCLDYLRLVPNSPTVQVLRHLAESLLAGRCPHEPPREDGEWYFLSAAVAIQQYQYEQAAMWLESALRFSSPIWQLRMLQKLLDCYSALEEKEMYECTQQRRRKLLEGAESLEDIQDWVLRELKRCDPDLIPQDWLQLSLGLQWMADCEKVWQDGDRSWDANCLKKDLPQAIGK